MVISHSTVCFCSKPLWWQWPIPDFVVVMSHSRLGFEVIKSLWWYCPILDLVFVVSLCVVMAHSRLGFAVSRCGGNGPYQTWFCGIKSVWLVIYSKLGLLERLLGGCCPKPDLQGVIMIDWVAAWMRAEVDLCSWLLLWLKLWLAAHGCFSSVQDVCLLQSFEKWFWKMK